MKFATRLAAVAAAAVLATPLVAHAQTTQIITFDDLPCAGMPLCPIDNGYAGMNWSQGYNAWLVGPSPRAVSGDNLVDFGESTTAAFWIPDGSFDLNSLYLGVLRVSSNPTHQDLTITGIGDGVTYSKTITPTDSMVKYDFDWQGVNLVEISDYTSHVFVDDISITSTPEPATIGMTALGLVATLGVIRRRRTKSAASASTRK